RPVARPDGLGVVHVDRGPDLGGDRSERNAAKVQAGAVTGQARVGKPAVGQYALAHTASATLGRPHHMQVVGGSGERNSSSGSTRMVALVCSLISASHSVRPQKPPYTRPPSAAMWA